MGTRTMKATGIVGVFAVVLACSSNGVDCPQPCPQNQICQGGSCVCEASEPDICNGTCTSLATDAQNCGQCGATCDGTCVGGQCVITLVAATESGGALGGIAVDATSVYWADLGAQSVRKIPKTGGSITTLASNQASMGKSLTIGGSSIFWSRCDDTSTIAAGVPIAGGAVFTIAAVSGTTCGVAVVGTPGDLWVAEDANAATMGIISDRTLPYNGVFSILAGQQEHVLGLAINPLRAFWTTNTAVRSASRTGTPNVKTLVAGASTSTLGAIAADANNVYWMGQSTLYTVPVNGGTARAVPGPTSARALVLDGSRLYFGSDYGIGYVDLSTEETVTLVPMNGVAGLALDSTSIYWTNANGVVSVLLKP